MNSIANNTSAVPIYMGTVCLERNRWGSKEPSFKVSEWAPRFEDDGFDGIELWENHYLLADEPERDALANLTLPISIFNTYASFTDDWADARKRAAEAIVRLKTPALKYNLGNDPHKMDEYRRNLLAWADELPSDCRLLCECHQGTVLEMPEAAAAFHADLDPDRFGIMIHPCPTPDGVAAWFDTCGERIVHLHMQLRASNTDPSTVEGRDLIHSCMSTVNERSFNGSVAIEFTRGIGKEEQIEDLYTSACADLRYIRKVMN